MDERQLREALGGQRDPSIPLDGRQLLRRARYRDRARLVATGAAVALVLAVAGMSLIGSQDEPERMAMRGAADLPVSLELAWLVEGTGLERGGTSPVAADEQVVFVARISREAFLCLDERDGVDWRRVFPPEGKAWLGVIGENVLEQDGKPQAFCTDLGSGPREYRLLADAEYVDCRTPVVSDTVTLQWLD